MILNDFDENLMDIEPGYSLPEVQLSDFIRLMQILFEYMHPILSGNQVSNPKSKKWSFEYQNSKIQIDRLTPFRWYIICISQGS